MFDFLSYTVRGLYLDPFALVAADKQHLSRYDHPTSCLCRFDGA